MLMVIYTLHTQGPRFVESHICQNRADMGHPSSVMEQAVRNAGYLLCHPDRSGADLVFPSTSQQTLSLQRMSFTDLESWKRLSNKGTAEAAVP